MRKAKPVGLGIALVAVAVAGVAREAQAQGGRGDGRPGLKTTVDRNGLRSLGYGGVGLLGNGTPTVRSIQLRKWDGDIVTGDTRCRRISADRDAQIVTLRYAWGSVNCAYATEDGMLKIEITVENESEFTISELCLQLLEIVFPEGPDFRGGPSKGHNDGDPTVICADYGKGVLVVANEDVGRPLYLGFAAKMGSRRGRKVGSLLLSTAKHEDIPRGWLQDPTVNRPIHPGTSDRYVVSLRFGPADTPVEELAGDIYERFAKAYPFRLDWKDRRPIGYLHLDSAENTSPPNKRGWTIMKDPDLTSEEGLAEFKASLMRYADNSVRILKRDMNAQGMIVWDVEGQEYPHATSYLGDPRSLPPEIDPIIDEFFQRFRDAGLRTGVCIRPQRPVRPVYGTEVWQEQVADPTQNMIEKITYAKDRWGCTLFYVDSNVLFDFVNFRPNQGDAYELMDAMVFKRLSEAHPDVLLIPEHENALYFAYTAPHRELRQKYASSPDWALRVYPKAFCVIGVADGPMDERRADLVEAVRRGDILLFRAWFDDVFNKKTKSIYEEAGRR